MGDGGDFQNDFHHDLFNIFKYNMLENIDNKIKTKVIYVGAVNILMRKGMSHTMASAT